jgi:FkbM family methyltransferase
MLALVLKKFHSYFKRILLTMTPISSYEKYRRDGYDDLITKDLGLDRNSNVVEVGGYLGDWGWEILNSYHCNLQIFEPVPEYFEVLRKRFLGMRSARVYNFGLSATDKVLQFGMDGPATGMTSLGETSQVKLRSVLNLSNVFPRDIDLVAINIEGGEYELIPAMSESNLIQRCNLLFIQFHLLDSESKKNRRNCRKYLERTHDLVWSYDFVWEAWIRRDAQNIL